MKKLCLTSFFALTISLLMLLIPPLLRASNPDQPTPCPDCKQKDSAGECTQNKPDGDPCKGGKCCEGECLPTTMCEPENPRADGNIPYPEERKISYEPGGTIGRRTKLEMIANPVAIYSIGSPKRCSAPCGETPNCDTGVYDWSFRIRLAYKRIPLEITISKPGGGGNPPNFSPKPCARIVAKRAMQRVRISTSYVVFCTPQVRLQPQNIWIDNGNTTQCGSGTKTTSETNDGYKYTSCKVYCER